jgi:hypothetical protein
MMLTLRRLEQLIPAQLSQLLTALLRWVMTPAHKQSQLTWQRVEQQSVEQLLSQQHQSQLLLSQQHLHQQLSQQRR